MDLIRLAVVAAAIVLVAVTVFALTGQQPERCCYRGACLVGEAAAAPGAECGVKAAISKLIEGSSRVILVMEGDSNVTVLNSQVGTAFLKLSSDFTGAHKNVTLVSIGFDGGNAVRCEYAESLKNKTVQKPAGFCTALAPAEGELMVILKYPNYASDEIALLNRTIEFRAKSGLDAQGMVQNLFEKVFF
jgi:hypothetical protein